MSPTMSEGVAECLFPYCQEQLVVSWIISFFFNFILLLLFGEDGGDRKK